jgi:hypothetical protein
VEALKSTGSARPSVSGVAAERVQSIVAAAEASAREIEERANQEAAVHVERIESAAADLIARASELRKQADEILGRLTAATSGVTESLRGGAEGIQAELRAMRAELGSVREARVAEPAAEPAAVEEEVQAVEEIREEPVEEPGPPDAEPEVVEEAVEQVRAKSAPAAGRAGEGARLIALNMALSGTPREETARYLRENFDVADQDDLLDEVYARAGG